MPLSLEEYLPQLLDPARRVAAGELRALSGLSRAQLGTLAQSWPQVSLAKRRQVVHLLVELAEENIELDYAGVFIIALRDPDDEVRCQSAEGLWEDEEPSTAEALMSTLRGDPAPAVRAAAAISLAHFVALMELDEFDKVVGRKIANCLCEAIENPAEPLEVRRRAVEAVGYLGEERAREAIARAYADPSQKMRASGLCAMGRSCDRRWLPALLAELRSKNAEMRYEAARATGELEDVLAVAPLVELLNDPDREVRLAAISALGKIGGVAAKHALQGLVGRADEQMSTAAGEALEELEADEAPLNLRLTELNGD